MSQTNKLSPAKQALLEQRLRKAAPSGVRGPQIPRRPDPHAAPLSFMQRQMWVIDQMTPGNPAYNMPYGYRLRGPLDVAALERSFNEIIKRHEALRTSFAVRDGEPVQRIHPALTIQIGVTVLDHPTAREREGALQTLASEESLRPFDLSRLPLLRVSLFKLGEAEHVLIVNLHHIVADGLSMRPLMDELDTFYRAFTEGGEPRPPELAVQYGDFAEWQRNALADDAAHAKQIAFWREQLGGTLPVLELPGDRPRPATQSFAGSNVFFEIPAPLARSVKAFGERQRCTFFMTMLAAFQVLLRRYSGAEDIVIGTPVAIRTASELDPLIGLFLNMVALRCDVSDNPTFVELLGRSRDVTLNAFSNGDVPLEALMKHLKFERDPSRNPIFQVALQVLSTTAPRLGSLDVSGFHFDLKLAQFDLTLHLYEEADRTWGRFEYCADLFDEPTIARLATHWRSLLEAMVASPERRVTALPLLSEPERRQLLVEWNETAADYPRDLCVHQLVEAQVRQTPESLAIAFEDRRLTYRELDRRSNQLARRLRTLGAGPGVRVGLCLDRSVEMVVGLLGILKAGAAYVPLDPTFPPERLRFMADDAHLSLLVSTAALAGSLGVPRERQVLLDDDATAIATPPDSQLSMAAYGARPEDPAYVIYTSGSTGAPKGVVIPHRAVVNFLTSMAREPGLAAADVVVAVTTLSFDIAVLELLLPLTRGATVVIATHDATFDGRALGSLLERHEATAMQATPVTWRLLFEAGWTPAAGFKALVGGEALPRDLADQLIAGGAELWNMYGPTETTVWSTCARITDTGHGITIGKPIANTTIRILDAGQHLCPVGVPGELCIGGDGVALGYWNRPELTAERFILDPFGATPGGTLYRTGDHARWRGDGTLEHLGRLDDQVKVRGFRIELGEIESRIARHAAVREVAVAVREDTPGDKRLVAYLVTEPTPADVVEEVRALLRAALPAYMVPTRFAMLQALPRTQNGKLDRKALPPPDDGATAPSGGVVAPRTPTEAMVMSAFRAVLEPTTFSVFDNFFDLGGHSLMAARLMAKLRTATGLDLPLRTLFERPTVAALAEAIDALAWAANSRRAPARAANRVEIEL